VINRCRSHLRHRYLQKKIFFWKDPVEDEEEGRDEDRWIDRSSGASPEKCADRESLQKAIHRARADLSPREQEVFTLKFDQELKISEIGNMLMVSENTVKVLLFRAARKMAGALKDYRNEM